MQISLKQSELVIAVRQYVANQGINLSGKDVEVAFSATRGEAGITATIDIENSDLANLMPNTKPALSVVSTAPMAAVIEAGPGPVFSADAPFDTAGNDAVALDEPKAKATSLFG